MTKLLLNIDPPVIAHRGASAYAPENTLAAFKLAKAFGANWVELDVMLTACGEVIVFHDESLDRITGTKGQIKDFTYEYLKNLDAGSWFANEFSQERIPTLQQVLACLAQNALGVNIELKPLPGKEDELAQKVLAILKTDWPADMPAPLISSFSVPALNALRSFSSSCQIGLLMDELFLNWQKIQKDLNCSSLNINQDVLNFDSIKILQSANLPLLSYTINDPQRAHELLSLGVYAFFTDCPDRLLDVIS